MLSDKRIYLNNFKIILIYNRKNWWFVFVNIHYELILKDKIMIDWNNTLLYAEQRKKKGVLICFNL